MRCNLPRLGLAAAAAIAALAAAAPGAAAGAVVPPHVRIDGAAPGDLAGASVAPAGDVNGDGYGDLIVGAPGAGAHANGTAAGAAYVVFGPFAPGTTIDLATLGARGIRLSGTGAEGAGRSVAGAGDVNGDGLADVVVGAPSGTPGQEGPQTAPGRAYVVFGSRTPHDLDLAHLGSAGIVLQGASHRFPDAFGWQVAPVGDVDHDGHADLAVAAPGNPGFENISTRGRAYVVFGRAKPGTIRVEHAGRQAFRIGLGTAGMVSSVGAAGDLNHDGHGDVAVVDGQGLHGRGAAYVVYGHRRSHPVDLAHLGRDGLVISGHRVHFRMSGAMLAGGRDVDGDGRPDVVIGEPAASPSASRPPAGSVWVVRGARGRRPVDLRTPGSRAWELAAGAPGAQAGAVVALGNLGGDARADVATVAGGSLVVLYGTSSHATQRLAGALPPSRGFVVDGPSLEPSLPITQVPSPALTPSLDPGGFTTADVAGDLNGDGRDDLLAGSTFASHEGRLHAGVAYLFFTPGP